MIRFARDVIGTPLDPWEQWAAIHLGELLPDGRPRFRTVLMIVARQNGKTLLAKILILYWLFVECQPSILGTSTDRSYAKRLWSAVCKDAARNRLLAANLGPGAVRKTIGEEALVTRDECEYVFSANNGSAGRSMTLNRWVCDELRQHKNWSAWSAASNAMNAVSDAQIVAITNMGDDESVVLDALRRDAIDRLETGEGDPNTGLFEWSAPAGSAPDDVTALAMANPNLNRRVAAPALVGTAKRVIKAGGVELAEFRTEVMCIRVDLLDPALDPDQWKARGTAAPADLAKHRAAVALGLDVSVALDHVALVAAASVDGLVHVDVVRAWQGWDCVREAARDLPGIVAKVRPRVLGWLPSGPAAALTADLAERRGTGRRWPPRGVQLAPVTAETAAVCMALPGLLRGELSHPRDPMLDAHVASAQKLMRANGQWVFQRRGTGPVNGAYAMAVAIHLARTLPPAKPALVVV